MDETRIKLLPGYYAQCNPDGDWDICDPAGEIIAEDIADRDIRPLAAAAAALRPSTARGMEDVKVRIDVLIESARTHERAQAYSQTCYEDDPASWDAVETAEKDLLSRIAHLTSPQVPEDLRKLSESATPGTLALRPLEMDDWGMLRSLTRDAGGFMPLVARVRVDQDLEEQTAARREDRQPKTCDANSKYIVACWNYVRSLLSAPPNEGAGASGDGWLPIESAPKDGNKVFLWHRLWGCGPQLGYYHEGTSWWRLGNEWRWIGVGVFPSHWHPTPPPPHHQPSPDVEQGK